MFVVLISKVSWALVGFPLYTLYRQGPAMIGCWQGRTDDEVCAELSNTESSFWRLNRHQCGEMIEKKFKEFDSDGSGGIDRGELTALLKDCKEEPPSEDQVRRLPLRRLWPEPSSPLTCSRRPCC